MGPKLQGKSALVASEVQSLCLQPCFDGHCGRYVALVQDPQSSNVHDLLTSSQAKGMPSGIGNGCWLGAWALNGGEMDIFPLLLHNTKRNIFTTAYFRPTRDIECISAFRIFPGGRSSQRTATAIEVEGNSGGVPPPRRPPPFSILPLGVR